MSDNELSETELIGLLGTYADALEKHGNDRSPTGAS